MPPRRAPWACHRQRATSGPRRHLPCFSRPWGWLGPHSPCVQLRAPAAARASPCLGVCVAPSTGSESRGLRGVRKGPLFPAWGFRATQDPQRQAQPAAWGAGVAGPDLCVQRLCGLSPRALPRRCSARRPESAGSCSTRPLLLREHRSSSSVAACGQASGFLHDRPRCCERPPIHLVHVLAVTAASFLKRGAAGCGALALVCTRIRRLRGLLHFLDSSSEKK